MVKEAFYEAAYMRKATKDIIAKANSIIEPLVAKGYTLTIRQLYYQFVRRNWLENKQSNYQRLASIVDDARKRGFIDWSAIEDRTRFLRAIPNFADVGEFITERVNYYAEDLWRDQENYCEVWIEKDALLGVIEKPCNHYRVPYMACRGYASSSELYSAGKRLEEIAASGKNVIIFHLGDHDPSGLDMTRVNEDSLNVFSRWSNIEVRRLALNMDQIRQYDPPPNPAKDSDARYDNYVKEYGESCWELDALEVEVLDKLVTDNIKAAMSDPDKFKKRRQEEAEHREALQTAANEWVGVERYLRYRDDSLDDLLAMGELENKTSVNEILEYKEAMEEEAED